MAVLPDGCAGRKPDTDAWEKHVDTLCGWATYELPSSEVNSWATSMPRPTPAKAQC